MTAAVADQPRTAEYFGSLGIDVSDWESPLWRLNNLYTIVDDEGKRFRFKTNDAQARFFDNLWYLNLILKARQLGFTTFIDLLGLDRAVFNSTQSVGIIAHSLEDAMKIFRNKVQVPYESLPLGLQQARAVVKDTSRELVFSNGSSIGVGTSMRSGTVQFLHVSEFGKISRKYPEKAKEIVTGSFNAVRAGSYIFVESTAEGRDGYFYKMVQLAQQKQQAGVPLTPLDFRLHFFAWHENPAYQIDPTGVPITQELADYFAALEAEHGIVLEPAQRAWYAKKLELMVEWDDLKREHPSHPDEAFEASTEGIYYRKQLARARRERRIRPGIPILPGVPVHTAWDLGRNDLMAVWGWQQVGHEYRFVYYDEGHGEDITYYFKRLQQQEFALGHFHLPHDGNRKYVTSNKSCEDVLIDLKVPPRQITVGERIDNVMDGIRALRRIFPALYIDSERCAKGIAHLENYQQEWDDRLGTWKDKPLHNEASNAADALREFAQQHEDAVVRPIAPVPGDARANAGRRSKPNWRAA